MGWGPGEGTRLPRTTPSITTDPLYPPIHPSMNARCESRLVAPTSLQRTEEPGLPVQIRSSTGSHLHRSPSSPSLFPFPFSCSCSCSCTSRLASRARPSPTPLVLKVLRESTHPCVYDHARGASLESRNPPSRANLRVAPSSGGESPAREGPGGTPRWSVGGSEGRSTLSTLRAAGCAPR